MKHFGAQKRTASYKIFIHVFFCVAVLIGCVACNPSDTSTRSEPVIRVTAFTLSPREVAQAFEFTGQTQGAVDAEIRARVEGVITAIHFIEGSEVKKGDLLYEIDPATYKTKVAEAQAKLYEAETRHHTARTDVARYRPLAEIKAVSARDLDQRVSQEGVARSAVEAARAVVSAAEIQLSYTRIEAPVSGRIGLTRARIGQFVGRDPSPIVLSVVSKLDPIHVRFTLSESEYLKFSRLNAARRAAGDTARNNTELTLVLADGSVHPQKGQLVSADNQLDPRTGSFTAEAAFPNPDEILRSGLFAKVRADWGRIPDSLVVPRRALRQLQGRHEAFVVTDEQRVAARAVKLGTTLGDSVVIADGLAAGDQVVLDGGQLLRAGMKVEVEEVPQPE